VTTTRRSMPGASPMSVEFSTSRSTTRPRAACSSRPTTAVRPAWSARHVG
jgi:hypothetical protein